SAEGKEYHIDLSLEPFTKGLGGEVGFGDPIPRRFLAASAHGNGGGAIAGYSFHGFLKTLIVPACIR
ncbi:MAG: hypothetical protein ABIV42_03595, partial [Nitrosospira sp.]